MICDPIDRSTDIDPGEAFEKGKILIDVCCYVLARRTIAVSGYRVVGLGDS